VEYLFSRFDYTSGVVIDFYGDAAETVGAILQGKASGNLPQQVPAKLTNVLTGESNHGIAIIRNEGMDPSHLQEFLLS